MDLINPQEIEHFKDSFNIILLPYPMCCRPAVFFRQIRAVTLSVQEGRIFQFFILIALMHEIC